MRRTHYKTCPLCNAHLDPGETCDCTTQQATTRTEPVLQVPADIADDFAYIMPPSPTEEERLYLLTLLQRPDHIAVIRTFSKLLHLLNDLPAEKQASVIEEMKRTTTAERGMI